MLTRIQIKNFKRLGDVSIELGDTVVFVGPNNSGKTTALQALALWWFGLVSWASKRGASSKAKERTGVTLNRRELLALPVPSANLLWKDLHTRQSSRVDGKQTTQNIYIHIEVEGVLGAQPWKCALEFDYANAESLYCRPVEWPDDDQRELMVRLAKQVKVAYLPPMSGLAPREFKAERGQINVLIGEGQTAQVLRNLCWTVYADPNSRAKWDSIVSEISAMFGMKLLDPRYIEGRSEVEMSYLDTNGRIELDLSSAGRGMQQTLLLLTYIHANPGATILLDEPDAHLEVLRQRQIFSAVTRLAQSQRCQIIAATHSEVVLNEAAGQHTVIAFVGKPHRINDQGSQTKKALLSIGFEHYVQAEVTGWVLYLEGSTDLAILRTLAKRLGHPAEALLERPYVDYVSTNTPPVARDRFYGLKEAFPNLVGLALFDRLERPLALQQHDDGLTELCWSKREIENYICTRGTLAAWAENLAGDDVGDLFVSGERQRLRTAMESAIQETESALQKLRKPSPWSADIKATDDFLDGLFLNFMDAAGLPKDTMYKKDYYRLAEHIALEDVDPEIVEKLDAIVEVAGRARL